MSHHKGKVFSIESTLKISSMLNTLIYMQLDFFEKMERIDSAIRQAKNIETMMSDVLQVTLEVLGSDRAWLIFPCDPTADSWRVPMERTCPKYPGAFALGQDIPMSSEMKQVCRESLQLTDVDIKDYRQEGTAKKMVARFSMLTGMQSAIYPVVGKPGYLVFTNVHTIVIGQKRNLLFFAGLVVVLLMP